MANRREKVEAVTGFLFLGSKTTADGDCSHEIKRCLLLGRKAMTNLDSVLKSRDISLPIKVHLVKAMIFPVVLYGCKRWTMKKPEGQRIDDFDLWCWRWSLRVPWTEIKPVNPKGNQSFWTDYSLKGLRLKLKLQYFGHQMQTASSLEKTLILGRTEGKRRSDRG